MENKLNEEKVVEQSALPPADEMLSISRKQLQAIIQEEVQKGLVGGVKTPKRVTERVANLRLHDGKPVVGYGNVREIREKDTNKMVAFMDISLFGEKEPVKVNYLEFLNTPNFVQVLVKKQTAEEVVKNDGVMSAENPDPLNNKNFQSFETDMEVVSYRYTAEVEVLEGEQKGKTFTLPANCLNQ